MIVRYSILNPSGNITAIVQTPVKEKDRCFVASKIMELESTVEQVGFLDSNVLNMAGGEFCGNATRCASFLTGYKEIICAGQKIKCENTAAYLPKQLEGITHYILESEIENPEAYIKKIANGQAIGLMFWHESESKLIPLVYVPAVDTLFWENSCASGTAALATYLSKKSNKDIDLDVHEPGGILHITTSPDDKYVKLDGKISVDKEGEICIPELNY